MSNFQVKLHGRWRDYHEEENGILKRAFMAGFPNAKFHLRGQNYQYDFSHMRQKNTDTGKERPIRAPYGWKAPKKPIVPPGPTTCIKVPPGSPGTTIEVPHPHNKSVMIKVHVPRTAKAGQAMLVPVPKLGPSGEPIEPEPAEPEEPAAEGGRGGYSTGAKVAMGAGGVALGGLAVAGAVLGAHAAEHGVDATGDMLADAAGAAGEAIGDVAGDAGEAIADAAEDVAGAVGDIDLDEVGGAIAGAAGDAGEAIADVGGDAAEAIGDAAAEAAEFLAGAGDDIADFVMDLF